LGVKRHRAVNFSRPKIIISFLLIGVLIGSNGCLTSSKVVHKAEGYTDKTIFRDQIKKGDKVGVIDASYGAYYVIQYPTGKDNSKLKMPSLPNTPYFFIARPHPAYYALLPVTIPVDIVIFPYTLVLIATAPPVSQ